MVSGLLNAAAVEPLLSIEAPPQISSSQVEKEPSSQVSSPSKSKTLQLGKGPRPSEVMMKSPTGKRGAGSDAAAKLSEAEHFFKRDKH